jgi:hypothetical protein
MLLSFALLCGFPLGLFPDHAHMRLHLVLSFRSTLARVHRDQRGAVSLETVLIIAAVAIPVLIFLIKYGWPFIRDRYNEHYELLEIEADRTKDG